MSTPALEESFETRVPVFYSRHLSVFSVKEIRPTPGLQLRSAYGRRVFTLVAPGPAPSLIQASNPRRPSNL